MSLNMATALTTDCIVVDKDEAAAGAGASGGMGDFDY